MSLPLLTPNLQDQVSLPISSKECVIPHFSNLYQLLTTSILDPGDASTTAKNREYESGEVRKQLEEVWIEEAKNAIIVRALKECVTPAREDTKRTPDLDREVKELCSVIAAYLSVLLSGTSQEISNNSRIEELMADDLNTFDDKLPTITQLLRHHIQDLETTMKDLASTIPPRSSNPQPTNQNPSRIPTRPHPSTTTNPRHHDPTTSSSSTLLQNPLSSLLPPLSSLTALLPPLSTTTTHLLSTTITNLETFTHSTQSRHTVTHATFLATVAEGIALKTQIMSLMRDRERYAQIGVGEALKGKMGMLKGEERALGDREGMLRGLLREFEEEVEAGGYGVWERLGREYRRVEAEVESVKRDIERLEGRIQMG